MFRDRNFISLQSLLGSSFSKEKKNTRDVLFESRMMLRNLSYCFVEPNHVFLVPGEIQPESR